MRAEGAEECPSARVVVTEVERRLGRPVFNAAAERSFEVEVTRFGKTYRSDVFVRDLDGHTIWHRLLQSDEPGCSALVNATALAIALVIDPEAAAHEPPPSTGVGRFRAASRHPRPPSPPEPPPAPAGSARASAGAGRRASSVRADAGHRIAARAGDGRLGGRDLAWLRVVVQRSPQQALGRRARGFVRALADGDARHRLARFGG